MTGNPHTRFRRTRRTCLELDDGTELTTSRDVLKAIGLAEEPDRLPASARDTVAAAEPKAARERALRLIAHRERSAHELTERLIDDGYPSAVIHPLITHLTDLGMVDDERFAGMFARSRIARGWGRSKVERALFEHRVDPGLVEHALEEACPLTEETQRAAATLGNRRLETSRDRERALRLLLSRGFTFSEAREAIDAARGSDERF